MTPLLFHVIPITKYEEDCEILTSLINEGI